MGGSPDEVEVYCMNARTKYERETERLTADVLACPEYAAACETWLPAPAGMSLEQANTVAAELKKHENWRDNIEQMSGEIMDCVASAAVEGDVDVIAAVGQSAVLRLMTLAVISFWHGLFVGLETASMRIESREGGRPSAY
jgi:hypothetical protein